MRLRAYIESEVTAVYLAGERYVIVPTDFLLHVEEQLEAAQKRLARYEEPGYITAVQKVLKLQEQLEAAQRDARMAWEVRDAYQFERDDLKEQYETLQGAVDDLIAHYTADPKHDYRILFWQSFDRLREVRSSGQ